MRKSCLFVIALAAAALVAVSGEAAEKVLALLGWVPYGRDAGFFAAVEQGFYKQAGLEVTLTRGFGGQPNIERIASGSADFTTGGDTPSLLLGRAKGLKLRQTGMIHAKAPYVLFTLKGFGIEKPKDLEGKIIGTQAREAGHVIFPALAAKNGIDEKKVIFLFMAAPNKPPSLLAGKVHATLEFATNQPSYEVGAEKEGKTLVTHYYSDWGLDVYAGGITTTDELIAKKPDLVRRFTEATMKGVAFGVENPQVAVENFLKHFPEQDRRIVTSAWRIGIDLLFDEDAKKNGIGYMSKEKMTYTRDLLTKYHDLKVVVPAEDLYTNEFLPKLFPRRQPGF